jgi:hypothetical protein
MTRDEFTERSRAVLGAGVVEVMAAALRCSAARFKAPAPVVVAILELIEAAVAAGISRKDLPARWRGEGAAGGGDLRSRFTGLFAPRPVVRVLRDAIELTPDVLNRRLKASPETRQASELAAIAELLEAIRAASGVDAWPARWRERAEPHDGRAWQARAVAVLGPAAAARLAEVVDLTPDYIGRAFRGESDSHGRQMRPSGSLCAVIELLETLEREGVPRERWPERWQRPERRRHKGAAPESAAACAAE